MPLPLTRAYALQAARSGLSNAQSAVSGAAGDQERAEAQIGVDVYTAMIKALE